MRHPAWDFKTIRNWFRELRATTDPQQLELQDLVPISPSKEHEVCLDLKKSQAQDTLLVHCLYHGWHIHLPCGLEFPPLIL